MTFTDVEQAGSGASLPNALGIGPRLRRAKRGHTTRQVPLRALADLQLLRGELLCPGDLVLAQVKRLGRPALLEDALGRHRSLFVGDELLLTWHGSTVPDAHLLPATQLLQPSGLAGLRAPAPPHPVTELRLLGRVIDEHGVPATLCDRAPPLAAPAPWRRPITLAVVGLVPGCGKTTAAAHLVRGLTQGRLKVDAAKLSGHGSCAEINLLVDAGARQVLDHSDAGRACTDGLDVDGLQAVCQSLLTQLAPRMPDVVVLDLAEGLQHGPTSDLLASAWWRAQVDGLLLCADDTLAALDGATWLQALGVPLLAISGRLSAAAGPGGQTRQIPGLSLLGPAQLASASVAVGLCQQLLDAQSGQTPVRRQPA